MEWKQQGAAVDIACLRRKSAWNIAFGCCLLVACHKLGNVALWLYLSLGSDFGCFRYVGLELDTRNYVLFYDAVLLQIAVVASVRIGLPEEK